MHLAYLVLPVTVVVIVLTWADTTENLDSIEAGAFRVFGDTLVGGNA